MFSVLAITLVETSQIELEVRVVPPQIFTGSPSSMRLRNSLSLFGNVARKPLG